MSETGLYFTRYKTLNLTDVIVRCFFLSGPFILKQKQRGWSPGKPQHCSTHNVQTETTVTVGLTQQTFILYDGEVGGWKFSFFLLLTEEKCYFVVLAQRDCHYFQQTVQPRRTPSKSTQPRRAACVSVLPPPCPKIVQSLPTSPL